MDLLLKPHKLAGSLQVIPSKSQAHRALICAALADRETELICPEVNRDMEATAQCLRALGAGILHTDRGYQVRPIRRLPERAELPCGESGSTLRFLLPVAGALGVDSTFILEGRLPGRPLSPLWEELQRMGCCLSRPQPDQVRICGRLQSGEYRIRGDVSSQFITGLLLAGTRISGTTRITLVGTVESKPYIDMTLDMLVHFGCPAENMTITGGQALRSPGTLTVGGDWSSGAFFLGANALGSSVEVLGLDPDSRQGDRAAAVLLPRLSPDRPVSGAQIPDLIPILAVVAACGSGGVFTDIGRLRLKESDRVETTLALIRGLGGQAWAEGDTLYVSGTGLKGGTVDAAGDHRIAMSAAIAATACREPVILTGAQCVSKSYPEFFREYSRLGGQYEQYIR